MILTTIHNFFPLWAIPLSCICAYQFHGSVPETTASLAARPVPRSSESYTHLRIHDPDPHCEFDGGGFEKERGVDAANDFCNALEQDKVVLKAGDNQIRTLHYGGYVYDFRVTGMNDMRGEISFSDAHVINRCSTDLEEWMEKCVKKKVSFGFTNHNDDRVEFQMRRRKPYADNHNALYFELPPSWSDDRRCYSYLDTHDTFSIESVRGQAETLCQDYSKDISPGKDARASDKDYYIDIYAYENDKEPNPACASGYRFSQGPGRCTKHEPCLADGGWPQWCKDAFNGILGVCKLPGDATKSLGGHIRHACALFVISKKKLDFEPAGEA